jgi:hypothetical protein
VKWENCVAKQGKRVAKSASGAGFHFPFFLRVTEGNDCWKGYETPDMLTAHNFFIIQQLATSPFE